MSALDSMPYGPTWQDYSETGSLDEHEGWDWVVYDQREGFTPAYAIVAAANATDAVEIAEEISGGRLTNDSETLAVRNYPR